MVKSRWWCVLVLAGLLSAATTVAYARTDGPPPLLDRALFFADPDITGAQMSPDGRFLAFLKSVGGVQNIWIKRTDEPPAAARPVTRVSDHPPGTFYWSQDSRYLLFTRDAGGNRKPDLFAVSVDTAAKSKTTPEPSNLTAGRGTPARVLALPQAAPGFVYVALSDGQRSEQDVYAIEIATGTRTLLRKNNVGAVGWVFDLSGKPRVAIRTGKYGEFEVVRLDGAGGSVIYSCAWSETCTPLQFDADGSHLYLASNHGAAADLVRLVALDIRDGSEQVVAADPAGQVDLDETIFSPITRLPAATVYEGDAGLRYAWRDRGMRADFRRLQRRLHGKALRIQPSVDGENWLVFASSDREPGETYRFDRHTEALTLQYRELSSLPRNALARSRAIRYRSSDGLEIPALLTLPRGTPVKSLPLVVLPHQGPWGVRDTWGYSGLVQFLANRGFAVLQPNFRGSSGFGKRFLDAGNRQWGERMQDDITWGVRRLVDSGVADPKRIAIFGLSYGGYAALAGATFTPDLYAAAIDMAGPSDLPLALKSILGVMPNARELFAERGGDPSTPEGEAVLERQSPINSAGTIKAPLLVIQGALDPISPKAGSDEIVQALRERHAPVTYLLAPDEGHVLGPKGAWAHPVNNLAVFAKVEAFLAEAVGTRHQADMPPQVARRLKEITVTAD